MEFKTSGIVNALNRVVEKLGALVVSIGGEQRDYACMVRRNTLQSIPTSVWTTILHNIKNADPENGFNTATGKYTIQITGFYSISAKAVFTQNAAGNWRLCSIFKNGVKFIRGSNSGGAFTTTGFPISAVSSTVYLEKGDYLENKVYQDSGVALDTSSAIAGEENFFSIAKINKYNSGSSLPNGEAWNTVINFQNGWVNYGGTFNKASYMKDSFGFVHLKGLVKSGTNLTAIFTLPEGYWPSGQEIMRILSNDVSARLDITTAGVVLPASNSSNAWISLDGIIFRANGY